MNIQINNNSVSVNKIKYKINKIINSNTSTVLISDKVIFKVIKSIFYSKGVFEREILILHNMNLLNIDFVPKLINYDFKNKIIMMSYCGVPINNYNKPLDYRIQLINILKTLKKYNIQHNDIKKREILIKNDKIYLCDFGWANINCNTKKKCFLHLNKKPTNGKGRRLDKNILYYF